MNKVKVIKLKSFTKKSGTLLPINFDNKFPIKVKRIFYLFGKKGQYRGDHAHKKCKQLFISLSGSVSLIMKRNGKEKKINLNVKKKVAILVPNLIWCKLKFLNKNSIVMVACDRKYEFNDYIEKYSDFKKFENK
jgi:dTDP-4-dehydrorhamnose 3,5-epimerase-like enzyme